MRLLLFRNALFPAAPALLGWIMFSFEGMSGFSHAQRESLVKRLEFFIVGEITLRHLAGDEPKKNGTATPRAHSTTLRRVSSRLSGAMHGPGGTGDIYLNR